MKRILLTVLLLAFAFLGHAQRSTLFDGGMMIHAGYVKGHIDALNHTSRGASTGIGGIMRFHVASHLRVGCEGYVSTLSLLGGDSYVRLGWGGVVVDGYWTFGRWTPFVGLTIGGGSGTTLLVFDGSSNDWAPEAQAVLHSDSFMLLNPYLGIEYALTHAVHLTLRVDRLTPIAQSDIPVGPRLFLGFVFAH